jgi:signal transduction histidine kinase/CheY-like chemotaxis protein
MTYWCETLGQRQLQSENGARIIAAEISSRLEADGDQMLRSLERLADRCQHISGREEWQGNVLGLLRDYKGLAALALIDQSGSVLQQSPAPSSLSDRSALPAQLLSKAAVEAIRSRRRITASLPGSGPNGRSVVIAILGAGTSDPCALSVVVELSPVAEQILRGNEASLYHVSIRVAGHQIRERGQLADADPQVRVTARANTLGLTWDIEVMPETALLDTADEGFALSNVVLLAGFLVTGLLVASANLWLVARDRNVLVERINGELRAENFRRAETERALVIAKNEADDANRSKSQFLAAMSHEIRTPMNAILGMAELLAESGLNQRQLEYTQVFQSAGSSLMRLLNDILDFSKMEAGKFHLSPVDFHLPGLIASTIKLMDSQVREKGLEFACEIDPALPPMVHGDPERLQQILVNLLSNATKFTPRGSVALRIRLSGEQSPSSAGLSFEVADTGIGIEPVKMGLIFESFEQGDNSISRRFGGSGLGLAISRSLAHQMGGRLTVESEVGKGSVFRFFVTLPVTKPIALKARELAQIDDRDNVVVRIGEPPSSPTPHSNGCRLRILIADDVVDNQFVLAEFLSDTPHFIDFASNGLEALERVREQAYDLVFMDVHMPVLDGLEATRAIREYERSVGRVPSTIVALTADALAEHRQACLEAGCSSHLLKPASRKLLLRCVARCAESRNALSPSKETSEIQTS